MVRSHLSPRRISFCHGNWQGYPSTTPQRGPRSLPTLVLTGQITRGPLSMARMHNYFGPRTRFWERLRNASLKGSSRGVLMSLYMGHGTACAVILAKTLEDFGIDTHPFGKSRPSVRVSKCVDTEVFRKSRPQF